MIRVATLRIPTVTQVHRGDFGCSTHEETIPGRFHVHVSVCKPSQLSERRAVAGCFGHDRLFVRESAKERKVAWHETLIVKKIKGERIDRAVLETLCTRVASPFRGGNGIDRSPLTIRIN